MCVFSFFDSGPFVQRWQPLMKFAQALPCPAREKGIEPRHYFSSDATNRAGVSTGTLPATDFGK
jgi:hypothetical protein